MNYLTIIYDVNKDDEEVNLFGRKFVEKNKKLCKMIINGKEKEICRSIDKKSLKLKGKDHLEIKLSGIEQITDISSMFEKCDSLNKENLTNFIPPTITDVDEENDDDKSIKIENIILNDKNEEQSMSKNSE